MNYLLRTHSRLRILLPCFLLAICTQCGPTLSEEQRQAAAPMPVDTVEVTSAHFEREISPELANWAVFEAGREIICVPPKWKSHIEDDGQELVLVPLDSHDSTERVTFTRLAKNSPSLDYLALARRLATSKFSRFDAVESDTLNHLVFPNDFAVERYTTLRVQEKPYQGYCLVYVDDHNVYQFRILLAQDRLNAYSGSLLSDIIGNLHIDGKPFVEHSNQLQQIIHLH
ncbi:hypothetical protein [Hymenobacter persicinus]|uniref:DUF1795 domain-containing protein n=1 Tax=Hymenobacter persicinus TaxID=2025506 RepID=A0A4Q5LCM6_9BACT|nr:hypothetical protein [Hymenobacter persicinus]RYU80263.1 hypothetical protein EWM57_08750 [Hymenobacter persicinus]